MAKETHQAAASGLAKVRNFGVIAHIDAGKTTVSERILFYTGKEHAMGEVHEGAAKMDYLAEEKERGITITAAATTIPWLGHVLNLIDTPGHVDFTAEVERSLRVLDGAVVVFDAVHGVEAQSETVWHQADRYRVPRLCFVNKMDRGGADYDASLQSIRERLGAKVAPLTAPIGAAERFEGVVDLVAREVVRFRGEQGAEVVREPVPEALAEEVDRRRTQLIEAVADHSDEVAERFLGGGDVPADLLQAGLRKATLTGRLFPVLCGAALRNAGIQPLLDAIVRYLPSPLDVGPVRGHRPDDVEDVVAFPPDPKGPIVAYAFKIVTDAHGDLTYARVYSGTLEQGQGTWNPRLGKHERAMRILRMHADEREPLERAVAGDIVALVGLKLVATGDTLCDKSAPVTLEPITFPQPVITMAIEPRSAADRERLEQALERLAREDPTFHKSVHEETGQTIVAGMGELHLEVLKNRLTRDFGVQANVGQPRVSYRQTVTSRGSARHVFQRLVAGKEQVATVEVTVEPSAAGDGSVPIEVTASPEQVPPRFRPSVVEGIAFAAQGGLDLGYPVIDVRATVVGGRSDEALSTEVAFHAAASEAFREACEKAGRVLLEPIMRFEVGTPADFVGPVQSDLIRRGALIEGDDLKGNLRVIRGKVPLSKMFGYSTAVRSLTQGRAGYSMEPAGFAPVPPEVAKTLMF